MDLLKQALANRSSSEKTSPSADKMPKSKATPVVQPVAKSHDTCSRAYIIENKPKNKVVREYFDSIVEKVIDFADNEED
jgi:hypothetical protein